MSHLQDIAGPTLGTLRTNIYVLLVYVSLDRHRQFISFAPVCHGLMFVPLPGIRTYCIYSLLRGFYVGMSLFSDYMLCLVFNYKYKLIKSASPNVCTSCVSSQSAASSLSHGV